MFLCRYLSVKSLPEAMRMEEGEEGQGCTLEVNGPAPGKAEAPTLPTRQLPAQAERSRRAPRRYVGEPPQLVPHQVCHSELDSTSLFRNSFPDPKLSISAKCGKDTTDST